MSSLQLLQHRLKELDERIRSHFHKPIVPEQIVRKNLDPSSRAPSGQAEERYTARSFYGLFQSLVSTIKRWWSGFK